MARKEKPLELKEPLLSDEDLPENLGPLFSSYEDGYNNGLYWPDKWKHKPGGPFIYDTPESKECHRLWMLGWEMGFKELQKKKKANPQLKITVDECIAAIGG